MIVILAYVVEKMFVKMSQIFHKLMTVVHNLLDHVKGH